MTRNVRDAWRKSGIALLVLALAAGCGDDDGGGGGGGGTDGGMTMPGEDGGPGPGDDGGTAPTRPQLPPAFSTTGCSDFGPLCSVEQDGESLELNCNGRVFTGTIDESGNVSLTTPDWEVTTGSTTTTISYSCTGRLAAGRFSGNCERTVDPAPSTGEPTTTCGFTADIRILPGVACLELPSTLEDVTFAPGTGPSGPLSGETVDFGDCRVIQDDCIFQAECESGVITGTVNLGGIVFSQTFVALADAQTPSTPGGMPAFRAGDSVSHSCTAEIDGTTLRGSCVAGATGRGATALPATSIYDIGGIAGPVPQCDPISPAEVSRLGISEHLFVLDSCEALRDGMGAEPGIGQPICAFRQTNCIWEVNCANDPRMIFSGRLEPGTDTVRWNLLTGTPCEGRFVDGELEGRCTVPVPGAPPCELRSTPAVPGIEDVCPVLETQFVTRGCGIGGNTAECRTALQHGCDFLTVCTFDETRYPSAVIAGEASYAEPNRGQLEFPGFAGYSCTVVEAVGDEIGDPLEGLRAPGEWYGQCETEAGAQCGVTSGFRDGFQIYFGYTADTRPPARVF